MEKYRLPERKVLFSDRNELDTTLAVTLDEYLPNAVRIVRCDVFPILSEWRLSEEGIGYSGRNVFRVIYVSDYNDGLRSANFEEGFSGIMKTGGDLSENDANAVICAKPVSASAKILSARQLELKGRIQLSGNVTSMEETMLFGEEAAGDDNICVLEESFESCEKIKLCCEKMMLEGDVTLSQDEKSVGEMLYTEIYPCITRTECKDGKINVWGDASASFVYIPECSDGDEAQNVPVCITRKLPFDAEIYADGITENGYAVIEAVPVYAKTGVSYDPYGENRVLSLTADMSVSGCVYECTDVCICTDVFGVEDSVCAKHIPIAFERIADTVDENIHISEKLHADTRNFSEITDCGMTVKVTGTEVSEGKMHAVLYAQVSLFGVGENGSANYAHNGFNIKAPVNTSANPSGVKAELLANVKNVSCGIKSGELIVNADAEVYGVLAEKLGANAVGEITSCEGKEKNEKGQIIVYYPDEKDSVWSVAKRYAVNPEMLKMSNGIEGDELNDVKMLVITK